MYCTSSSLWTLFCQYEVLHAQETSPSRSFYLLCMEKTSQLTAFYAWDSSPHLTVTSAQLMRPGIGPNTSAGWWLCITSRPTFFKGVNQLIHCSCMKRTRSILSSNGATESTDLQQSLQIEDMPLTYRVACVCIYTCIHYLFLCAYYIHCIWYALVVRRVVIIVSGLVYI